MTATNTATEYLQADWPAPAGVRALCTTRRGGHSLPPYDGFNLATHVGDDADHVRANRARLQRELALPGAPRWLSQVHGCQVCHAGDGTDIPVADASYATTPGVVCAVLTADCLPVVFCDHQGRSVATAHAGWRGLANGVLEATAERLPHPPAALLAWLGPAIGPDAFEVGAEVYDAFVRQHAAAADAFRQCADGKWLADIYRLARIRLHAFGIDRVYGGGLCTYSDAQRFFSYRRQARTGRIATLAWLEQQ